MVDSSTLCVNATTCTSEQISAKISYLTGLLDLGYWIFPLHGLHLGPVGPECTCDEGASCSRPGKHAHGQWSSPLDPADVQSRRSIDARVREWPDRGWGLHVGLSGLAVLDVDPRHGGEETLDRLVRDLDLPLRWPHVITGSGGLHYYFRAPSGADAVKGFVGANGCTRCAVQLGAGLELFFGQHFVVLPHSPHKSGGWYTQAFSGQPGELPAPLISHLAQMEIFNVQKIPSQVDASMPNWPGSIPATATTPAAISPQGRAASWLALRDPAAAGQGGRQHTCSTVAALIVDFGLDVEEVWPLLAGWNETCLPPWSHGDLRDIVDWACGLPGERGAKLTASPTSGRRGPDPEASWMAAGRFDFSPGPQASPAQEKKPTAGDGARASSTLTAGEWAFFAAIAAEIPIVEARDHRHPLGCQPVIDDDDDQVDDGSPDTPIVPPAIEPPTEDPGPETDGCGERCTCGLWILQRHKTAVLWRNIFVSSRRWDCPRCGPLRRAHYCATIRHHLSEWDRLHSDPAERTLWIATVSETDWDRVASSIRFRHGQFFRIDTSAMGQIKGHAYTVVSTVPTSHCTWSPISAPLAAEVMCGAIEAISSSIRVRIWWSSREWQMLPDRDKKEPEWEGNTVCKGPQADRLEVAAEHGSKTRPINCPGRFYPCHGYQGTYPAGQWDSFAPTCKTV